MPDHWGHERGTGETAVGMDGESGPEERALDIPWIFPADLTWVLMRKFPWLQLP